MNKERRLGRGLEALLSRSSNPSEPELKIAQHEEHAPETLSVYEIESNPFQPRQEFNDAEIESLTESIREHGLLQAIVVRQVEGRYQLVAGERRLRAAIKAGWSEVPVRVIDVDERQSAELAIVENLQRKDLNPLEKAASFQKYLEQYGCTQEELAGRLKIDRSTIANLIRLLELPAQVRQAIQQGSITQGHARALLPLGDEREQVAFSERITRDGLSVRDTESLVQDLIRSSDGEKLSVVSPDGSPSRAAKPRSEQLLALEQELRAALGTKVDLRQTAKGRGRIVVHFKSHDEFERLRQMLSPHHAGEDQALQAG